MLFIVKLFTSQKNLSVLPKNYRKHMARKSQLSFQISIMKAHPTRLCIYPKDIQRITGKSERYSRALIHKIRTHFNMPEHHLVSIQDFCNYTGLAYTKVIEFIID